MTVLRVGFTACDVTPPLGLPLGGYGARTAPAAGVLDPLFCRAAVLDDGETLIGLVVLDLVYVFTDWVSRVRRRAADVTGLQPDHLLIAATHTHAGPGVFRSALRDDTRVRDYEDALVSTVADCLAAACRSAVPARISFGSAPAPGVAANRRDPSLPIDNTVRVLGLRAVSGKLCGVIANFSCHSTVLSAANCSYSGDLFGAASAKASRALAAPVLLINGAGGDVSTRFTRQDQSYPEVQRLGEILAAAIVAAARSATALHSEPTLAACSRSVPVQWRHLPPPPEAGDELQGAARALDSLRRASADPAVIRLAESRVEGAQAALWLSTQGGWDALFGPRQPAADLQVLRCDEVVIAAAPGELFSSAGRWLRAGLGERTLVAGYANDYLGYFIPESEARAGGYESLVALVDPACEVAIRTGLVAAARRAGCKTSADC